MAYTEADRALALEILARHGGEVTAVALDEIRHVTGKPNLPKVTVWRWLQKDATNKKAASSEVREQVARALDEMLEEAARKFVNHAIKDQILDDASTQQAMTSAGIAIDKMRLLRGLPTEILSILPEVIIALGGPSEAVKAFNELLARKAAAKRAAEDNGDV